MTDRDNYQPNIAYFGMRYTPDGKGHFGAVLVVDNKGIPLEWRCSVPVRPSSIQTALYGAQIEDYIAFNLCGQPLLESLTEKPTACLVESESQFNLQEYVSIPVFYAYRADDSNVSDSGNGESGERSQYRRLIHSRQSNEHAAVPNGDRDNEDEEGRIVLHSSADFAPVVLRNYPGWSRSLQDFLPDLRRLFESIDLVEPFDRITIGCQLLCQEDERYK
jgi:hypothetical protein